MEESLKKLPWKWTHKKTSYKVNSPLTIGVDVVSSYKVRADAVGVEGIFNTSHFKRQRDCANILKMHPGLKGRDEVYSIYPDGKTKKRVFCDMTTEGGGWTVIQRRINAGTTNFYRTWKDYKTGFGQARLDYWLGNDAIHTLTSHSTQELWVDLEQFSGSKAYARYSKFAIDGEKNKYKLSISGYSGNAGDGLRHHNGIVFATKDRPDSSSCTKTNQGAWWYNGCYHSNLNGPYQKSALNTYTAIVWIPWKDKTALKSARMMIRPKK
ncbi:ryncolin-4-like [Saccostrea echinata]|uniref:ryncolin-4-like n=1 Tax=Saccostrea echinata TaxID=191078 RepID=UPI002A838F9F|nr:ryncolin-4-like [Saccostrea echinata]